VYGEAEQFVITSLVAVQALVLSGTSQQHAPTPQQQDAPSCNLYGFNDDIPFQTLSNLKTKKTVFRALGLNNPPVSIDCHCPAILT